MRSRTKRLRRPPDEASEALSSVSALGIYDRSMLLRRRVAVPAFLGVFGLIWVAAHALAHDVVASSRPRGHAAHGASAEGYVAYLPTSLALCLTLAIADLERAWPLASDGQGGPAGRSGSSAVVPVLGFAADTLVELAIHGPTAAAGAELVPVLLVGLLVQLPFALVAVRLAGKLLWLVERVAWALRDTVIGGRPVELGAPAWAPASGARALRLAGSSSLARPSAPNLLASGATRRRARTSCSTTHEADAAARGSVALRSKALTTTRPATSTPRLVSPRPAPESLGASRRRRCLTPPRRRRLYADQRRDGCKLSDKQMPSTIPLL